MMVSPSPSLFLCTLSQFHWGALSEAAAHDDHIFGEALHLGHLEAAQLTIEVQHPPV